METMGRIGRERGLAAAIACAVRRRRSRSTARSCSGSPQQVIDKILYQHELFGHDRHLLQLTVGPIPHADVLRAIELFGTEVAPVVRREVASRVAVV